jgi:F-type H+-transporting ATPase subunit gamma
MAKSREIVKRRKSINNIRKITKTMEMIATSRYKRSYNQSVGGLPYTKEISEMVAALSGCEAAKEHPLLKANDKADRTVLLVLTSNRGLCGGYNAQMIRHAIAVMREMDTANQKVELRVSGKKGIQFFQFFGRPAAASYQDFSDHLTPEKVDVVADELMGLYSGSEIAAVKVVYPEFLTNSYRAKTIDLLPFPRMIARNEEEKSAVRAGDYIFSPSESAIFDELIPMAVRSALYQCFTDAVVSEHLARMRAMKAATDNADQMNQALTRLYNRARQTQITSELMDIIGGVEALK